MTQTSTDSQWEFEHTIETMHSYRELAWHLLSTSLWEYSYYKGKGKMTKELEFSTIGWIREKHPTFEFVASALNLKPKDLLHNFRVWKVNQ